MVIAPTLYSGRLTLRPFKEGDAPAINKWCSSLSNTAYVFWHPHRSLETTEKILANWIRKRRNLSWGIELNGELIGEVEIIKDLPDDSFEVGYILREDMWGHGYMNEALHTVLSCMEGLGKKSCYAETDERNASSRRLLEKLGFVYKGTEEGRLIEKKNVFVNIAQYRKEL